MDFRDRPVFAKLPTEEWRQTSLPMGYWMDARLERWNSNDEWVAVVSIEPRIAGSGVSLDCKTQSEHFFGATIPRAGYLGVGKIGCHNSGMEINHVCRQA
ncbi:hypothetical protein Poly41_56420 [Novipirellula artificiosorum]|uniref:Uncharacterized protein n=1 Tax=Novipirellula artificiosorum TaxID=2528016 RepID=A0A5C6D8X8_9BACT|nr:hypothetical protein Poly41_56420 [Novipirellula artificiosorum]